MMMKAHATLTKILATTTVTAVAAVATLKKVLDMKKVH
jgi:hypothetical protein